MNLATERSLSEVLDLGIVDAGTACSSGAQSASKPALALSRCDGRAWARASGTSQNLAGQFGAEASRFSLLGGFDHSLERVRWLPRAVRNAPARQHGLVRLREVLLKPVSDRPTALPLNLPQGARCQVTPRIAFQCVTAGINRGRISPSDPQLDGRASVASKEPAATSPAGS
jgi:hypothetical protein